jgi:hypothetical protein
MVTLTNARNATKMMSQPTEIKILRNIGRMTERGQKSQSASRRVPRLQGLGEPKTKGEFVPMAVLLDPSVMAVWFDYHASDVGNKNPSLITKTMTNLSKLCGFANHVTNNDTKK